MAKIFNVLLSIKAQIVADTEDEAIAIAMQQQGGPGGIDTRNQHEEREHAILRKRRDARLCAARSDGPRVSDGLRARGRGRVGDRGSPQSPTVAQRNRPVVATRTPDGPLVLLR